MLELFLGGFPVSTLPLTGRHGLEHPTTGDMTGDLLLNPIHDQDEVLVELLLHQYGVDEPHLGHDRRHRGLLLQPSQVTGNSVTNHVGLGGVGEDTGLEDDAHLAAQSRGDSSPDALGVAPLVGGGDNKVSLVVGRVPGATWEGNRGAYT